MNTIPDTRRFQRHVRGYGMAPPEGAGEDRRLLKRAKRCAERPSEGGGNREGEGRHHCSCSFESARRLVFEFHPWKRSQSMLPPEGDGEDRLLEAELDYYRNLWWDHVDKTNGLKGRAPLEAGMARARKD